MELRRTRGPQAEGGAPGEPPPDGQGLNGQFPGGQPARPDTPCVAVCSTTFDEVCRGCGRTVAEVAHWVSMNAADRELVWRRILAQGYPRRNS